MQFIKTLPELVQYQKKIERQKEIVILSVDLFNVLERIQLLEIYNQLENFTEKKIAQLANQIEVNLDQTPSKKRKLRRTSIFRTAN